MTVFKACLLTSFLWLGVIALFSQFGSDRAAPKVFENSEDFAKSEFGDWIVLPRDVTDIRAHFSGGRDTNYRLVSFSPKSKVGLEVLEQSLEKNVQYQDDVLSRMSDRKFSLDGLFSVFRYGDSQIPEWWVTLLLGKKCDASLIFWERDGYGYGYLLVTDENDFTGRILQFSSQHLDADAVEYAFPKSE